MENPTPEGSLVEQKWYDTKTLVYDKIRLGGWAWGKKHGFRTRIVQIVANMLRVNAILFSDHQPLSDAIKEGFDEVQVGLRFSVPLDLAI